MLLHSLSRSAECVCQEDCCNLGRRADTSEAGVTSVILSVIECHVGALFVKVIAVDEAQKEGTFGYGTARLARCRPRLPLVDSIELLAFY